MINHKDDIEVWIASPDCVIPNRSYSNPNSIMKYFNTYKKAIADKILAETADDNTPGSIEDFDVKIKGLGTTSTKSGEDTDSDKSMEVTLPPVKSGIQVESSPLTPEEMYTNGMRALGMILTRANEGKWKPEEKKDILKMAHNIINALNE